MSRNNYGFVNFKFYKNKMTNDPSENYLNLSDEELRRRISDIMAAGKAEYDEFIKIEGPNFIYREHPVRHEFKLRIHDLRIENSEQGEDVADFHYLPRGVINLEDVKEEERSRFKTESITSFVLGCEALIKFMQEHPETRLGKINKFYGETNEFMANFLKKGFGVDSIRTMDQSYEYFKVELTLEDIIKGLEKFRREHPGLAAKIDKSKIVTA